MSISPLTIYLWQFADEAKISLSNLIPLPVIATIALGIMAIIFYCISVTRAGAKREWQSINKDMDVEKETKRWLDYSKGFRKGSFGFGVLTFILLTLNTLCPSSKTIAMMFVIPKIAESKVIQQDLPDIYEIAIKALKEKIAPPSK